MNGTQEIGGKTMDVSKSRIVTKPKLILAVALLCCFSSCNQKGAETTEWIKPDSTELGCTDYLSVVVEDGVLTNNVWNKNAANNAQWRQCLESKEIDGAVQYGWSWSWPTGKRVIYAYPQIKRGVSPWAPEPKFDDRFPFQIESLEKMRVSYDVEILTNGQHNLATSLWLTHRRHTGTKPDPENIAAEIMIWTYATDKHFNPGGKRVAVLTLGDSDWEVWLDQDWEDKSGENDNQWVYLTFKAKQQSLSTEFDVIEMLNYAAAKKWISRNWFVSDIELGNEIMGGQGITWVNNFEIQFKPKAN